MSIQFKIMTITVVSMASMLAILLFYLLPEIESKIMKEKLDAIRHQVESVVTLIEQNDADVQAGRKTLEQAQQDAAKIISGLRYEQKEYFWINDLGKPVPKMIMHPASPSLNGKVLDDSKFNKATSMLFGTSKTLLKVHDENLFVAFSRVAEQSGHGFVTYEWPKSKQGGGMTDETYPKLSYVKLYKPWGWVVGTGIYIDDVRADVNVIKWSLLGIDLLLAVFSLSLAYIVSHWITKPLKEGITIANRLAQGDLSVEVLVTSRDETGLLLAAMKTMVSHLRDIVGKVAETSTVVAATAMQVSNNSAQMAPVVVQVASQTTTVATACEEMSATSGEIAKNCMMAAEASRHASQKTIDCVVIVANCLEVMNHIVVGAKGAAQAVENLGSRSEKIGSIIETIEDIADQTNLLALNAAIEAARAGDQGRGFAVVADEVRALAERTSLATEQIGKMIKEIQHEIKIVVAAMEEGAQGVVKGRAESERSGEALQNILQQINEVVVQINQIATAAEEQTFTSSEISNNMLQITDVVQQTSTGAHESAQVANQLNNISVEFQTLVTQFVL